MYLGSVCFGIHNSYSYHQNSHSQASHNIKLSLVIIISASV